MKTLIIKIVLIATIYIGCSVEEVEEVPQVNKIITHNIFSNDLDVNTYAIIDSLRIKGDDRKLLKSLVSKNGNYLNLWHKDIRLDTKNVFLYLVKVEKASNLSQFLEGQYANSAVTFLQSSYKLKELQSYYSSFTFPFIPIEKEESTWERMIFGFADPLILGNYIETLKSKEKIEEFFAASLKWLVPDNEKENEIWEYSVKSNGSIFNLNKKENRYISEAQMKIFSNFEVDNFVRLVLEEYKDDGYDFDKYYGEKILTEKTYVYYHKGKDINIDTESGVYYFILINLLYEQFKLDEVKLLKDILKYKGEFKKIGFMKKEIALIKGKTR